ncbi:helix-turn-helix transcriptional regulator [Catellatospora sp. NPDC049111]|uniref:helix-turn-helix transcriptional regulator n=1 Tax=Catellatospora sp. NPDC049111 TaxID=3155271 RepID=UPI0034057D9F
MLQEQVVPSLMKWGVSPQADLVYRTLVAFGPLTAGGISRSLTMQIRQVRGALEELTALGAAAPGPAPVARRSDGRIWSGRPPAHVSAMLRDRHHRNAVARYRLSRRMSRTLSPELLTDHLRILASGARPLAAGGQSQARMMEINRAGCRESISVSGDSAYSTAAVKAAAPIDRAMAERRVTMFSLGVPASDEHETGWHDVEMHSLGMQYRELPELPGRYIIFDRTTALVRKKPFDPTHGMWEINDPTLVAELLALFLQDWSLAKEPHWEWTPPHGLSSREGAVVALLATGLTDAAVAARLDLSVRTIAYTMSTLMDRYDVINRFQLGLRLGTATAQPAVPLDVSETRR